MKIYKKIFPSFVHRNFPLIAQNDPGKALSLLMIPLAVGPHPKPSTALAEFRYSTVITPVG
jgi:hypothetical protein